jgi:hypothetical protein
MFACMNIQAVRTLMLGERGAPRPKELKEKVMEKKHKL